MRVVAIDLSLTSTGVADAGGTWTLKTPKTGMARLQVIRDSLLMVAGWSVESPFVSVDLVVIEGYSMGTARQQSHAHGLGELGGVVRLALYEAGIAFVDVPPAVAKKYATGKGNANKGQMLEAASKRSGFDFDGDNNRADAFWLRALALDAYGEPVVEMPALNRSVIGSVTWPALSSVSAGA